MRRVYVSALTFEAVKEHLRGLGFQVREIDPDPRYGSGEAAHPDLRMCETGGAVLRRGAPPSSPAYPDNASMCALVLDGFLVHRLDITDAVILQYCRERGFREIHVNQGYTKCSCVRVDGRSVITSDPGVYAALAGVPELSVLKVRPGFVSLPGYGTGFIGGASGRVGDEVVFNGDLSEHPDFRQISAFIAERGLRVKHFPGLPLTDVGSIIEETE